MRSCFPPLYDAERRRGSVVLGMLLGSGTTPRLLMVPYSASPEVPDPLLIGRVSILAGVVSEILRLFTCTPPGPAPVVPPGPLALRSQKESWAQWSLRRGLQSLPESMAVFLKSSGKVELHLNAPVKEIHPSASEWKVGIKPHYSTTPLLHYSTTPLLNYCTREILKYSITELPNYMTTPLIHY